MQAFLISDDEGLSVSIRHVLLRHGHECPAGNALPPGLALRRLAGARAELIVVILSPDPDRALEVLAEVRGITSARVLVVGPAHDPKLIRRSYQLGAGDYIDENDLDAELEAALARLQSEGPSGPTEAGRVLALLGPSGGSGASTLAVNIATVLAKEHKRALLFDLKLEAGDLAALLDVRPTYTLADLCQNISRLDRVMFERSLAQHDSGVHLLAPPRNIADIRHITPDGVRQALALARTIYPYVVLDLDHSFREEQVHALRQADLILLVMRLDFTSLRNTQRTLDYLGQLGLANDRVRVVVNRYGQPKEVPAAKAEEALGLKIFHYVPDDPKTINRANNNGVPAVLEAPSAKVCRSVAQLAVSVNGHTQGHG
jgi:pilus assembly protein CpaE